MNSIRQALLKRLLLGTAIILGLGALLLFLFVRQFLADQQDINLSDRLKGLASLLFQQDQVLEFEFSDELMPEYEREHLPAYFQLFFADGRPIEISGSLAGHRLEIPKELDHQPYFWSPNLPGNRKGRALAKRVSVHHVYPEEGPDRPLAAEVIICVATGIEERQRAERLVLLSCLGATVALLGLLSLSAHRAVSRGLRPARHLAATLDTLEANDLPSTIDFGPLPLELQPVARRTQDLVSRLDEALQRERRTSANIAHELRTPIAELITVADVALHKDEAPEERVAAIETLRDIAWRMGQTVSMILNLARIQMDQGHGRREQVDLLHLIRAIHQGHTLTAKGSSVAMQIDLSALERGDSSSAPFSKNEDPEIQVVADPEALGLVLTNLLENALCHSPGGSVVQVSIGELEGDWELVISNPAQGLALQDLALFEEPFWQKDHARANRDHSGLGLALARAVAKQAELSFRFELAGDRLRTILSLPKQELG